MKLDWLKHWAERSPEKPALVDGLSDEVTNYTQFFDKAQKYAGYLFKYYSLRPGDRVAILAYNRIESIYLFFALQRLGVTLIPLNYRLSCSELKTIINDADPKILILEKEFFEDGQEFSCPVKVDYDELIEGADKFAGSFPRFNSHATSVAMILYTSGTTGLPKGVQITMGMMVWNSLNTIVSLDLTDKDSAVQFLPMFHTGGWHVLLTPIIFRGGFSVVIPKFDPDAVLNLTEKFKCSLIFGVPTTMARMVDHPSFPSMNLKSVRFAIVGGEPMSIPLIESWHAKGVAIRQGYGLTEFGPNVFSLPAKDAIRKKGSIGFPNFFIEARVVTESGTDADSNQIGELWLKGPTATPGYWQNPQETDHLLLDGWLRTGDLVRFDDDGYFYVVGRKKEMFISGGENVYPAEVEKVLTNHCEIKEAAVIGVSDIKWGEVGKAFIVRTKQGPTRDELIDYCNKHLARYKVPKHIEFISELPKGDSGKILKKQLSPQL